MMESSAAVHTVLCKQKLHSTVSFNLRTRVTRPLAVTVETVQATIPYNEYSEDPAPCKIDPAPRRYPTRMKCYGPGSLITRKLHNLRPINFLDNLEEKTFKIALWARCFFTKPTKARSVTMEQFIAVFPQ